ncbi:uncharacterized protein LOC128677589 [Plodia interpunctella]|uniref:uncharacterized protein LOC128677589 n=1 Tax=Plodia interpunctella TaxID=58824 RepID=UPI0023687A1C|nr:uncharacterized protein LOC128677589 isoform X1 [Plodia interpunctella]
MSTYDDCKEYLSRAVTTTTIPRLGEVSEIVHSNNQSHNMDDLDLGSSSTSNLLNCRQYGSEVSKKLTYEILKRYTQVDPLFMFDKHVTNPDNATENKPQKAVDIDFKDKRSDNSSTVTSVRRRISKGIQYEMPSETEVRSYHYSRSNSVCNVEVPNRYSSRQFCMNYTSLHNMKEKKQAEKMTYCRPVNNYYNEELIFKSAERNRRLQKLVRKMTVVREREKQVNAWNNYINELRHKHGYHETPRNIPMPLITPTNSGPELIEDYYRTNFKCQQSNHCKNLLKDFYEPCTSTQTNYYEHINPEYYGSMNLACLKYPIERSESYAAPHLILKRDRSNQCGSIYYRQQMAENANGNTILVDTQYSHAGENSKRTSKSTVVYRKKIPRLFKTSSIQTNLKLLPIKKQQSVENNANNNVVDNILKVTKHVDVKQEQRLRSFECIENKLDVLIKSVNTLISEVRKPESRDSSFANNNRMSVSRSVETVRLPNTETFSGGSANSVTNIPIGYKSPKIFYSSGVSKLDNIIVEELNKSNEIKRDIENILNGDIQKSCSVQIINDFIPTRDRSTEVTNSLETKAHNGTIRSSSPDQSMTIAVNTDPLGLQALLRISKETVKNVLSFMQNIPYQNLLQLPLIPLQNNASPFICSICGAIFMTTTQLTEHIHSHVRNRHCCVCRHITGVISEAQNPRRLFFCEFCGKPFSRAYCCELHQQSCAKRLGRLRDVTSSLVLLR